MSTLLADGNLLIALVVVDHVHHDRAVEWFATEEPTLATCPITEGTLLRFLMREGGSASAAIGVLDAIRAAPWHRFWADDIPYEAAQLGGVIGHRQVTDAYLVALARHHGGRVATLDKGLAALHGGDVLLLGA
ncbi:MAG: PIN domain-containing protein [Acidimicrobiia bacterium]|nr:PIN domain-containing protein [Microthrixaceae bacterium]MCB9374554.1 PIN domain-containing protein [Microthrixaceae bacterium]MCB9402465.1 PIN domain-containing protein [Microthrixaceae bacterium]RTL09234.1 MAG: PIN domain-containing protein [Acidimicrobiia bacterium]HPG15960.1 PIN domain-containing protein [Microthrixaceae bacterium]